MQIDDLHLVFLPDAYGLAVLNPQDELAAVSGSTWSEYVGNAPMFYFTSPEGSQRFVEDVLTEKAKLTPTDFQPHPFSNFVIVPGFDQVKGAFTVQILPDY